MDALNSLRSAHDLVREICPAAFFKDIDDHPSPDELTLDFLVGAHERLEVEADEKDDLDEITPLLEALSDVTNHRIEPMDSLESLRQMLVTRPVDTTRAACSICDEGFRDVWELERHTQQRFVLHSGQKLNQTIIYVCVECLTPWMDPEAVIRHVADQHGALFPPYPASIMSRIHKLKVVQVFTSQVENTLQTIQNCTEKLLQKDDDVVYLVIETETDEEGPSANAQQPLTDQESPKKVLRNLNEARRRRTEGKTV